MRLTSLVMIGLLAFPVHADELKHIPKWTMVGPKACYEFDEAKKLLEIDSQLEMLLQKDLQWMGITKDLQTSITALNTALTAEKNVTAELKANGEQLTAELMDETERANKAEARAGPFPSVLLVGGAALGVGVIAGILLGVYVAK